MKVKCLTLIFLLASCGGDPLPKPDLLNHPESEWPSRTDQMSTKELYYVYRYQASLKPPYIMDFAGIVGSRGREAIDIWLDDIEARSRPNMGYHQFMHPIVSAAAEFGRYDLCGDQPQLTRASQLLAQEYGSERAAINQLEEACNAGQRMRLKLQNQGATPK